MDEHSSDAQCAGNGQREKLLAMASVASKMQVAFGEMASVCRLAAAGVHVPMDKLLLFQLTAPLFDPLRLAALQSTPSTAPGAAPAAAPAPAVPDQPPIPILDYASVAAAGAREEERREEREEEMREEREEERREERKEGDEREEGVEGEEGEDEAVGLEGTEQAEETRDRRDEEDEQGEQDKSGGGKGEECTNAAVSAGDGKDVGGSTDVPLGGADEAEARRRVSETVRQDNEDTGGDAADGKRSKRRRVKKVL
ncbi:unnamed protein product [Closterium sp. NIES-64]|nr:unnamed protein product [Closterium sp. NIES-64]CAI6006836.1 unnamed protein product [Closterium sp. NIES-65]